MNFTLRQLVVFDAVARSCSVSQASVEISLSQSAVSLSLKELEKNLGEILFERRGKKLLLNEHGRRLLPRAHALLAQARDFQISGSRSALEGTLKICASTTIGHYLLPGICGQFLASHPQVQIDLSISSSLDVVSKVENVNVDLGIIEGPCNHRLMHIVPWVKDKLAFFAAPDHPLAGQTEISIHDLAGDLWFLEPINFVTRTVALSAVVTHLPSVRIGFVSPSVEAIKRAVRSGKGVGCLSQIAIREELARAELIELPVREIHIARQFSLLTRKDDYRSELQMCFEETLLASNV